MEKSRQIPALILVMGVTILVLSICLIAGVALIRALPGRYAYYLPEPLQALRHNPHPDTLPTPATVHSSTPTVVYTTAPLPSHTPTVTLYPSPTPTPLPSSTPPPTPTPTPTPPIRFTLSGLRHEPQGWNNCGPTTLAMALSYWGRGETQYDCAVVLKPDAEDKNVSPWEMEAYARELGLGALVRVGGTRERLKALVRAGFPVIVETWYVRDARDQLGHYRLVVGYDDELQEFLTYDSLHGPDESIGYRELDELWRVYNRTYLIVYGIDKQDLLVSILESDLDDAGMYERALETARAEAGSLPESCVAYADCA